MGQKTPRLGTRECSVIDMTIPRLIITAALILISAVVFWNSVFLFQTFNTLHISNNEIRLQLNVVADDVALKPYWGLRRYGTKDEFFVHGRISDGKRRPVSISIVKDGATRTESCAEYEGSDCFFSLRLGARIDGPFVITIADGKEKFARQLSFAHKTKILVYFIEAIKGV